MSRNQLVNEPPWRRRWRRRWGVVTVGYVIALSAVLGVLAERRWGWMEVWARTPGDNQDQETPVPRGPEHLALEGMSSHGSSSALARGWDTGGMQEGYFPPAPAGEHEVVAPWSPAPLSPGLVQPEPSDSLGPGLGDLKVMNLRVPDLKKFGKR